MDTVFTQEITIAINDAINSVFYKIGLFWFIVITLISIILYFVITRYFSKRDEKIMADIEKEKVKDIELWKQQKDLMFEFVTFLETKIFNNSNLEKDKKEIFKELNLYYAKLYLVMETNILKKINQYIVGTVSNVQRFYFYKELRKQLMQIFDKEFDDKDCPYIAGEPNKLIFVDKDGHTIQKEAEDFFELKKHYPFVKEHENEHGKIKTLPFFDQKK